MRDGGRLDSVDRLAATLGVDPALVPPDDAAPEELLRAAEMLGRAITTRGAPPISSTLSPPTLAWDPLPSRAVAMRTADQRRATVANVIAWAEAAGAPLHGVAARVDAAGNVAMFATRDIARGDLIFALPRQLMLVDDDVAPAISSNTDPDAGTSSGESAPHDGTSSGESAPHADAGASSGESAPHAALAAWLAVAVRDPSSPWRAYLDDLPPHVPELPVFRMASELAALDGTTAHAFAAADRRDLLAAHASHRTPLLAAAADRRDLLAVDASHRTPLPLADFAWGWAIVRSRAYHAPGSFEPHLAMMPMVDLFDHGHGDTTWTYDPVDARFAITAERAIHAGEPVTFTYGDFGNGRLLAHYGFTLPDDPFAEALVVFERPTDPAAEIAAHLLWQVPLASPACMPVADRVDHRFARALSVARLHAATPAERARMAELGFTDAGDLPYLDSAVEDRALALLADAARRSIAKLSAAPPATGDRSWDASCARVRAGERAVLAQYATLADGDGPLHPAYRAAFRDP